MRIVKDKKVDLRMARHIGNLIAKVDPGLKDAIEQETAYIIHSTLSEMIEATGLKKKKKSAFDGLKACLAKFNIELAIES